MTPFEGVPKTIGEGLETSNLFHVCQDLQVQRSNIKAKLLCAKTQAQGTVMHFC